MDQQPENQQPPMAPPPVEGQPVVQPIVQQSPSIEMQPVATPAPMPLVAPAPYGPAPVPTPQQPSQPMAAPAYQPYGPAPQPMGAPALAFTPPMAPAPTGMGGKPKSALKLIAWLAGGFIVLAGILVGIYFMFFYVSKADYQKAADAYNSLQTITDDAVNTSNSSSLGSDPTKLADKLDSQATEAQKKYGDMASLRAVQKDGTVNKAYNDLKQTIDTDIVLLHAIAKFMRTISGCASTTSSDGITECASELKNVKTDSPIVNDYAAAMAKAFQRYIDGDTSGRSDLYAASTKFSDATKKLLDDGKAKSEVLKTAINDKLK